MSAHTLDESPYQESRRKWLIVLLALIINFLLLLLLFVITIDNDLLNFTSDQSAPVTFQEMPEQLQQQFPMPSHEVAALKPGASNFGMPEELQDDEMVARVAHEHDPSQPESGHEGRDTKNIEKSDAPHQEPLPTEHAEQRSLFAQHPKELEKSEHQQEKKSTPSSEKTIMKQQEPFPQPEKIKAPVKKELTFTDLAKGFMSSLDQGGNDLVERKGNENIRPDFEEMRYLSYLHKIWWHMQNEWRRDTTILNCAPPAFVATCVSITIDKDGVLKRAAVVESCGNNQLDDAVLRGIRNASPYPPLPAHLKKDQLTIDFGVKHVQENHSRFRSGF